MVKQKRFEGTTTIRITDEVHDKLAQVGKWGESLSDIIDRLIQEHYELERMLKRK
jgi:predicted CopG family antitoxin